MGFLQRNLEEPGGIEWNFENVLKVTENQLRVGLYTVKIFE